MFFSTSYIAVSKKKETSAKKKECQDIRLWIKSSVNHCYCVATSSGDIKEIKEQKWKSLIEYMVNKPDACEHGELDGDRQWLREGKFGFFKEKNVVYK